MKTPAIQSKFGPLAELLYQSYVPKILGAAIDVNVFEALNRNDLSLPELCERLKTDKAVTEALMDILVALDLAAIRDTTYRLTQTAKDFLVKSSAANQLGAIKTFSGSAGPFDNLAETLLSGPSVFNDRRWSSREAVSGMEQQNRGGTLQSTLSFLKEIPEFGNCETMCDFAGNVGYFSFAFMEGNENLHSHVYDLPEVCALGREMKTNEKNYDRITYHDFDATSDEAFGDGYDLFFSSHFLYEINARGTLADFLSKVNRSMKPGGLFVSNHITSAGTGENHLMESILELMTRCMGYPTHQLSEEDLQAALSSAGFGNFRTRLSSDDTPFPVLLLSAIKK